MISARIARTCWLPLVLALLFLELVRAQSPFAAYTPATCAALNVAANRFDSPSLGCVDCTRSNTIPNRIGDGGKFLLGSDI
jgi:hypothetical protein